MSKTIEMIISYTTDGSDYQYNDNHGILIRCADCKYYDTWCDTPLCGLDIIDNPSHDDYCSRGERA